MDLHVLSSSSVWEDIRSISMSSGVGRSGVDSGRVWVLLLEDWWLIGNSW